ncbi:hypothetical protein [Neokomagataea thailandica]|uniref:hypothetical protein n=1 Tax=Neokomagataea thailandica TaxID=661190 RepID=UPI00082F14EC|nr:hypothetical protein [Neokomagataea thailandica]
MGLFGASASSLTASCSVRQAAHILLSGRWPAPAAGTLRAPASGADQRPSQQDTPQRDGQTLTPSWPVAGWAQENTTPIPLSITVLVLAARAEWV